MAREADGGRDERRVVVVGGMNIDIHLTPVSGGESLAANIALVRNNAAVAADIARELAG